MSSVNLHDDSSIEIDDDLNEEALIDASEMPQIELEKNDQIFYSLVITFQEYIIKKSPYVKKFI